MGYIKRSSATSLVGWLVLAVALLSAISVTAYAMTRSGAAKPPKRSLASAVHRIFTAKPVTGTWITPVPQVIAVIPGAV